MGELVPTTYARALWNAAQETELPHHGDILTAEQAQRINDHFTIEVHTGIHGLPITEEAVINGSVAAIISTPKEFEAAAEVARSLAVRDRLFMESYGHRRTHLENWISICGSKLDADIAACEPELQAALADHRIPLLANHLVKLETRLETERAMQQTDPFHYAANLACMRGNDVHFADIDAFELAQLEACGQKTIHDLAFSNEASDKQLGARIRAIREKRACNTVKDYALAHLPPAGTPAADPDKKPRLVLMYGQSHQAGIIQNFDALGLNAQAYNMYISDASERAEAFMEWRQLLIDAAAQAATQSQTFTIPNDVV